MSKPLAAPKAQVTVVPLQMPSPRTPAGVWLAIGLLALFDGLAIAVLVQVTHPYLAVCQ